MPFRFSRGESNSISKFTSKLNRRPRRIALELAAGQAIEALEGRVLLAVVNSLIDPLTGPGVDPAKWVVNHARL